MKFFKQLFCKKHDYRFVRGFEIENDDDLGTHPVTEYKCSKCSKIDYNVR